jgi:hypothetical protein
MLAASEPRSAITAIALRPPPVIVAHVVELSPRVITGNLSIAFALIDCFG